MLVIEAECVAAVAMNNREVTLLKFEDETITADLHPSRGRLERGKVYRVTFEEIEGD